MYRIVQITDLHLGAEGERPRDVDVRGNLSEVLNAIRQESPDMLVVTGDLSFRDGDRDAYRFARRSIERCLQQVAAEVRIPYHVIAGNHDVSSRLAQEFGLETDLHGDELYYAVDAHDERDNSVSDEGIYRLIFLDSATATMSDEQLSWLSNVADDANRRGLPAIVFVHHPPIPCHCRFMDSAYPFTRGPDLVAALESIHDIRAVYCGHYHASAEAPLPGRPEVLVHVTPSLWFQIDRDSPDLVVSDLRPAYRVITLDSGSVASQVKYVRSH